MLLDVEARRRGETRGEHVRISFSPVLGTAQESQDPSSFRVGRKLFGAGHIGKRLATREELFPIPPFTAAVQATVFAPAQ